MRLWSDGVGPVAGSPKRGAAIGGASIGGRKAVASDSSSSSSASSVSASSVSENAEGPPSASTKFEPYFTLEFCGKFCDPAYWWNFSLQSIGNFSRHFLRGLARLVWPTRSISKSASGVLRLENGPS